MITLEAHYVYLLLASTAIMLALACLCFTRFDKRCRQLEEFWASPTGTALNGEQDKLATEQLQVTLRLEQRVSDLQRALMAMDSNKRKSEAPRVERNLPIENAVRMARHGASVDDLKKSCGLNIGEAQLMQKLHGNAHLQAAGVQ